MTGKVLWFSGKKGYGFLKEDSGSEYFVHITNITAEKKSAKYLAPDQDVTFDLEEKDGKTQAINVIPGTRPPRPRRRKAS